MRRLCIALVLICLFSSRTEALDKVDSIGGNVVVKWQRGELFQGVPLFATYHAYSKSGGFYLLQNYRGQFGIELREFDYEYNGVREYKRLFAQDTQGYIYNSFSMSVQSDNSLRLLGNRCWYYSVPPFHLTKISYNFTPYYLDLDSNLSFKQDRLYKNGTDTAWATPRLAVADNKRSLTSVTCYEDSLKFRVYNYSLDTLLKSFDFRVDSCESVGSFEPVEVTDSTFAFLTRISVSGFVSKNSVFIVNNRTLSFTRFDLPNPRLGTATFTTDGHVIFAAPVYNDSTAILHLYKYTLDGHKVWEVSMLSNYTIFPQQIKITKDQGFVCVGQSTFPHFLKDEDKPRNAVIVKCDSIGRVQWYHITGFDDNREEYNEVVELEDRSFIAFGSKVEPANQLSSFITKYVPGVSTELKDVEVQSSGLTLMPNPSSNVTEIQFCNTDAQKASFSFVDIFGRDVQVPMSLNWQKGILSASIDVSQLNSGMYWIYVKCGKASTSAPLIVSH